MPLDRTQFKRLVSETLEGIDMGGEAAVNLLLGTAAQESVFGTYLRQLRGGPALGIFQMEPATFEWLKGEYGDRLPQIKDVSFEQLEWDLRAATIFARLRYRVVPSQLPAADDIEGMARYWKINFNSVLGKGREEDFVRNYARYVIS